jgi:hypothetical protein
MSHKPTPEQYAIITAYRDGGDLTVEAGAGTGKTSTLKMLAATRPNRRGVYLAYNKAIATDAEKSFPSSVLCKTAHSLAFRAVARPYAHRLKAPRVPAAETARILGINQPVRVVDGQAPLSPQQLARIVSATIDRFCHSADPRPGAAHLPVLAGLDQAARDALASVVVPWARKAWQDITNPHGGLRFTHDCYLKMWQLSRPQLGADYVLLDEAQDANPAVADIVERQDAQRILVGDRCQSIYGWRGAVDAMAGFAGERLYLSQSFRFGPAIAGEANRWLSVLHAQLRLTGYKAIRSTVGPVAAPEAILCRSNAGAFARVIESLEAGRRTALVGGGGDIKRMAEAAARLKLGEPCDHPELLAFTSWSQVQDYVEQDSAGSDLKTFVALVDNLGTDAVLAVVDRITDETAADTVVSTAHKSKGREWRTVRISPDFREPKPDPLTGLQPEIPRDDAMLAYVAVTRAKERLDPDGLAWIANYTTVSTPRPSTRAGQVSRAIVTAAQELIGPQPTLAEFLAPVTVPAAAEPELAPQQGCTVPGRCMLCDPGYRDTWPAPLTPGIRVLAGAR